MAYEILLQIFERYFAHTEETDAQLTTLADATIELMLRVDQPARRPDHDAAGRPRATQGRTAGPSFELFYETDYLMPHRDGGLGAADRAAG